MPQGAGDFGPPDGWCFEGFHTIDRKRARFRADSTLDDDKLISCVRMKCFNVALESGQAEGRSRRAAARKSMREASSDDESLDEREMAKEAKELVGGSDLGSVSSAKKTPKSKSKKRKSEVVSAVEEYGATGNTVEAGEPQSISATVTKSKPKTKAGSMKPRATAVIKMLATPPTTTESAPDNVMDVDRNFETPDVEGSSKVLSTPKTESRKPRKKPRKSTDGGKYKPSKDEDRGSSEFEEEDDKPKRKRARQKATAPETTLADGGH
jgi:hypothetical protein